MIAKRAIVFISFVTVSTGITLFLIMGPRGASGPTAGVFSWAFFFSRSAGVSSAAGLSIFLAYFVVLAGISTIFARYRQDWGPAVPIIIHVMGTVIAALTFGPLLVDEKLGTYLWSLLLSLGITIGYIWLDWHFAITAFCHRRAKGR